MKIKICGIKSPKTVSILNRVLPDYIGFVFAASSRRVSFRTAQAIAKQLDNKIQKVGVFVNADITEIERLCSNDIIDIVQLHGREDEQYIREVKKVTDKKIIKAIKVDCDGNLLSPLPKNADYYLLDAFVGNQFGGVGKAFAWQNIDFTKFDKPVFLAGGINQSNIENACSQDGVYCIDVSSGVETLKMKDDYKISKIVSCVK